MTISSPERVLADSPVTDQWRRYLAGALAVVDLRPDRTGERAFRPASVPVPVRAAASGELMALGDSGWLAAFAALLSRLTGQRDFVIGSPAPKGVLAHRITVRAASSFTELVLAAETPPPSPDGLPIPEFSRIHHAGRRVFSVGYARSAQPWAHADVSLLVDDSGTVMLGYDASLFTEHAMRRMAAHLGTLVTSVTAESHAPVAMLEVMPASERHRVLVSFNETAFDDFNDVSFADRVARVAATAPDLPALTFRREHLNYGELDARANRLAHHLIDRGVRAGDFVGMFLERSADAVIATIAVLRTGAAVVPLDPADDDEWIAHMLRDSKPVAVVTDSGLQGRMPVLRSTSTVVVRVDGDAGAIAACSPAATGVEVAPEMISHLVYTSGSTGLPKGTLGRHHTLNAIANWAVPAYGIDVDSRGTWVFAPGFAIGRFEWMPFLTVGAHVFIADAITANSPASVRKWLLDNDITHTMLVTGFAQRIWELEWPSSVALRHMVVLGEPVRRWPRTRLPFEVSVSYGSTEAAVVTCGFDAARGIRDTCWTSARPSAGKPVAGVRIYVLDEHGAPVPVGAIGEIMVAGDGVCAGYHGTPDESWQRFVDNRFAEEPCATLFRTGDLGRWRDDGTLDVVGRQDAQTWVGGIRVEVGEIEAAIADLGTFRELTVVASGGGLFGYVVPVDRSSFSGDTLLAKLRDVLPPHLVPSAIMDMDVLPRLANGKLDRQALARTRMLVTT